MRKRNDIARFEEWQEHQYNPGYWFNRYAPDIPPKISRGEWRIVKFQLAVIAAGLLFALAAYFIGKEPIGLGVAVLLLIGCIPVAIYIKNHPVEKDDPKSQTELEELRRKRNQAYRSKIRNKRKDVR